MKIGILDQVPLPKGATVKETLDYTMTLAKEAEKLGYSRYWLAEHHNTNGLLSAAPEILMTRIAAETSSIRVGSGGVLLPQYSPLKVAETFKLLETLFPGRVDLGVGRSPGGTERTRLALTDGLANNLSEFPRQLDDLFGFLHNKLPRNHDYRMVKATPRTNEQPPLWVLGLSPSSGKISAERGLGLTFGHFINPDKWSSTLQTYREHFKPSLNSSIPQVNVCVFVICAETTEKAEELAFSQDMWLLGIDKGDSRIPSLEDIHERGVTSDELKQIKQNRRRTIVGTPEDVKQQLLELSKRYETDDFLIISNIYDFHDRLKSYQLIAEVMDLH
ncbi:LLM class flavin-dependent oxidoreductase [Jeotgalibacillus soli]|uniref:Luciferase-like domain-containing protein n=1 Tax=Jeotgalibacillus soli TaxID=889306 RepID=A0A0C2RNZ1_9BACL|nr:LLM class flavin-dependent oxidoreductase [Jeotgalibacillus soli]KIL51975.1 hypothetical protein KP78_03450 [Jeotgalibacillus soli]